jgi:hypothetical protein
MKFKLPPPSKAKIYTDKKGNKYSPRDLTAISSATTMSSSLIAFGQEHYDKYSGSGKQFLTFKTDVGKGYLVYEINDNIDISDVFVEASSKKQSRIVLEALIETAYNTAKSTGKTLVITSDSEVLLDYIDTNNQSKKEQKIEDKFHWKKE